MKLEWTETATRDLIAIRNFIAADNPAAARKWIARLRARAAKTVNMPYAGRKVPELGREDIREVIEGHYRIIYRVLDCQLVVLTVFEGHRLFPGEFPLGAG